VEEKPEKMLNQDKSPGTMDRTSKEASRASEDARKGGRRRRNYLLLSNQG
jgi:hypothetical protein